MNKIAKLTVTVVAAIAVFSCKKDGKNEQKCVAGPGGDKSVICRILHHSKLVQPRSLWVKYNAYDAPGSSTSSYDLVVTADTTSITVTMSKVKCGVYYLFATGYDTSIKAFVKGGLAYDLKDTASQPVQLDIAATE